MLGYSWLGRFTYEIFMLCLDIVEKGGSVHFVIAAAAAAFLRYPEIAWLIVARLMCCIVE